MGSLAAFFASDAGFAAAFSAVATLAATILGQAIRGRVRLIWFSPNSTHFTLHSNDAGVQPVHINSGQIIVQNLGRQAAEGVQITSIPGAPPAGYVLIPSLVHETRSGPRGEWIVEIPFISPGEVVTLQVLNGPPIDSVRSAGGSGRLVPVIHQRLYPRWLQASAGGLMFAGVVAIFFALGWLISRL